MNEHLPPPEQFLAWLENKKGNAPVGFRGKDHFHPLANWLNETVGQPVPEGQHNFRATLSQIKGTLADGTQVEWDHVDWTRTFMLQVNDGDLPLVITAERARAILLKAIPALSRR